MNSAAYSMAAPETATDTKWVACWEKSLDDLYSEIVHLTHLTHYHLADMEFAFDQTRARSRDESTTTLSFSNDGIDARIWLTGEMWVLAKKLKKKVEAYQLAADRDADAEVRS